MKKEDIKRWGKSILVGLIVFAIFSIYLYLRRGYYDLYIINKVFGSTAAVLGGITLLIGPLSKKFIYLAKYMTIRRHLGLLAFALALAHVVASLAQTQRFEWFSWYLEEWIPVTFGIIAITVWIYMTYISRDIKIQQMGPELWKSRLSLAGKLGFIAIFLHLTVMKYPGWVRWIQGQVKQTPELNPSYPPASLFVFIGMIAVILLRLIYGFISQRKDVEKRAQAITKNGQGVRNGISTVK